MRWIGLVDNNHFLKFLYPAGDPVLDGLRLYEVHLHQDGPSVSLRFDLNEYPEQPPAKWRATNSNTVQVRLMGIGVRDFSFRGWASNNIGRLVIKENIGDRNIELRLAGIWGRNFEKRED